MAQTLWERLTRGPEVVEFRYTNPAKAKIGQTFNLDILGYRDLMFTLRQIVEYKRNINGKQLNFADYILLARPVGKDDVEVRVRFMPVENPDAVLTHNVVVLTKYDEMKFCQELDNALRDDTGELIITDNNTKSEDVYWRINNLRNSWQAECNVIRDVNNDGKIEENEVERKQVEYWDFSRIMEDEAKQQFTQYLFVEMDKDSKVQTMWRGEEADQQRISIM